MVVRSAGVLLDSLLLQCWYVSERVDVIYSYY